MYVFGGSSDGAQFIFESDLHTYNVATRNWSTAPTGGPQQLQGAHDILSIYICLFVVVSQHTQQTKVRHAYKIFSRLLFFSFIICLSCISSCELVHLLAHWLLLTHTRL